MPEAIELRAQLERECPAGRIRLETDPAWMCAAVTLHPSADRPPFTEQDIRETLAAAGVTSGIDEGAIARLVEEAPQAVAPIERRVVAVGRPPLRGRDAYLDYPALFALGADGTLPRDPIALTHARIVNVVAGDMVATYHPLEDGQPGQNVRGEYVPVDPGVDRTPRVGRNLKREGDRVVAAIDGRLLIEERELHADENITIEGNLTLLHGDIDFVGHIFVRGDIEPGLHIHGHKQITVSGSIFDSSIVCDGNLRVKRGIVGDGTTRVEVRGDLEADFAENVDIKVWGNCVIGKSLVNGRVLCGQAFAMPGYGHIVSGQVYARDGIRAAQIGIPNGSTVKLVVGIDAIASQRVIEIDSELDAIEGRTRKVQNILAEMGPDTLVYPTLSARRRGEIDKLIEVLLLLSEQARELEFERVQVVEQTKKNHEATIAVRGFVHADTVIQFPLDRLVVGATAKRVTYGYDLREMKIVTRGLAA
jgi:uncharacterized protein